MWRSSELCNASSQSLAVCKSIVFVLDVLLFLFAFKWKINSTCWDVAFNIAVKPNRVTDVKVLDQELNNIKVQWQPPVNDRELVFLVSYRSQWQPQGVEQVRLPVCRSQRVFALCFQLKFPDRALQACASSKASSQPLQCQTTVSFWLWRAAHVAVVPNFYFKFSISILPQQCVEKHPDTRTLSGDSEIFQRLFWPQAQSGKGILPRKQFLLGRNPDRRQCDRAVIRQIVSCVRSHCSGGWESKVECDIVFAAIFVRQGKSRVVFSQPVWNQAPHQNVKITD